MKDASRRTLEASRPTQGGLECVEFCLSQLYEDETLLLSDIVAGVCTYEELIGALLLARDEFRENQTGE